MTLRERLVTTGETWAEACFASRDSGLGNLY
jgi:hypothetical protein